MKLIKTLIGSLIVSSALLSSAAFAEEKTAEATTVQAATENVVAEMPAENVSDKLNINTATASEIQKALTGIGAKKAGAIVQYREKHGNFTSAEQLLEVQGIGKATLEKNRDRLAF